MWQVAVTAAAALAGSQFIAKHLFSPKPTTQTPVSDFSPVSDHTGESNKVYKEEGVFWFSSAGSSAKQSSSKKKGVLRKNGGNIKKDVGGFGNASVVVDQRKKKKKKKVSVCLKRRKICRNAGTGKPHSSCSKDCSSFGQGLGLGIMYMMSAGKSEMSKLSTAIDETAKVVHELKSEFNKRKSSHCQQLLNLSNTGNSDEDTMRRLMAQQIQLQSCELNKYPSDTKVINHLADSEYASSVLTEEQQPEGTEMDQLEAELVSELQKLPLSIIETSDHGRTIKNLAQIGRHELMNQSSTSNQSGGVSPAELNTKLSHLLVKQQESHISELESELNLAYSKLQEKEDELRALKDCVRRLTEFSLSTLSDEETEVCAEQERCGEYDKTTGLADAIVGMKRAMRF